MMSNDKTMEAAPRMHCIHCILPFLFLRRGLVQCKVLYTT